MEDSIAEKLRPAWTDTPFDQCEVLLAAAQFYLEDGEPDRAVAIWKHLITDSGASADLAILDYAQYLFDEHENDAAYAELIPLLEQWRILSRSWLRAVKMVEEREPGVALDLYTLAMACFGTEHVQVPAVALRYAELAAACRRLRWELRIRLTDTDLHAVIGRLESAHKRSRLLRLIGEPEVSGGHLKFWGRALLTALHRSPADRINLKQSAAYYRAVERALRAHDGGRPVATRLESADWTHLKDLTHNVRHIDDLQAFVGRYDQGTSVQWPPGRNQPCWCESGIKYKKCCGAIGHPS